MLRLIVGIEIEITRLVGKFKLSQNKEARDIRGASAALLARGEQAIGAAMDDCAARRDG
ncbi:putative transcriptional regulator [Pseudomonas aeruginosa]|nr:putative transcriptional regulator [Pseudomonas aeruginosa]